MYPGLFGKNKALLKRKNSLKPWQWMVLNNDHDAVLCVPSFVQNARVFNNARRKTFDSFEVGDPLLDLCVEACRSVFDPEIPVNIYDLGLIYTIDLNAENDAKIVMTLTAPGCPVAGEMPGWVQEAIMGVNGIRTVDVDLVWEPPWGMDMMSDEARLELGFM